MRTLAVILTSTALSLSILVATPASASACVSGEPSFRAAVHRAQAIATVTVVDGFQAYSSDPTHRETYRVERVLKGDLPARVTLTNPWTGICHDTIGFYAAEGTTIVVAFDVTYYDQPIHPIWYVDGASVFGTAGVPRGVRSLPQLEAAIRAELGLPDTSTRSASPDAPLPQAPALAAGLVAFLATAWWIGGRRSPVRPGRAAAHDPGSCRCGRCG
jgi:hypothetical protein